MTYKTILWALFLTFIPLVSSAQSIKIRAMLFDKKMPVDGLYLLDQVGVPAKTKLVSGILSESQITTAMNGSLVFFKNASIDAKNPSANVAASAKLPSGLTQAIVIIIPSPAGAVQPYQLVVINDSYSAFPKGEARVINMLPVEAALQAGEHRVSLPSGKVTNVSPVTQRDAYRMAQTTFYQQDKGKWSPITERQLKYLDDYRRVFIVAIPSGTKFPTVTTLLDIEPGAPPSDSAR